VRPPTALRNKPLLQLEWLTRFVAVYNEAVLGKSNEEYCDWIQRDQSWGGAIEIGILSDHYGIEICAIDVTNVNVYRFGEIDGRVLLVLHHPPARVAWSANILKLVFSM
jgi:hypothetical protein